jgi:hypothetical protein
MKNPQTPYYIYTKFIMCIAKKILQMLKIGAYTKSYKSRSIAK